MLVCSPCRKEMNVVKTGMDVRYNSGHHVYSADLWQCPKCGALIANTARQPQHLDDSLPSREYDIEMD